MKVEIRPVNERDLTTIADLEQRTFSDAYPPSYLAWLAIEYPSTFLVADFDGQVLGYTVGFMQDVRTGHVMSIAVDQANRRRGIGRSMLAVLLKALANSGAERVLLEVRESNLEARKFYSALGFRPVGKLNSYYRDGEDAVAYEIGKPDLVEWVQGFNSTFST